MKVKLTCGLIIILFILNAIIVSLNNEYKADTLENNHQEISSIKLKPISNAGLNWSQFEAISEPIQGKNFNTGHSTYPKIAFENEKIYVIWHDNNNTNGAGADMDIFFRYYDGNIWSDIQVISEPIIGQDINTDISYGGSIAVENGKIYVVWYDQNDTNGCGGGETDFEIFYRCNLTGSYWEDIQVISEPIPDQDLNTRNSTVPEIAVENGKIYVTWTDVNNTNGAGTDHDIFYRCNLTGFNWEPVQVISEPIYGKNFNSGGSSISSIAVENGKIYVVWGDGNNTNGAGSDGDIFYRCNLTGSNWEDVQVISEPIFGQDFNIGGSGFPKIAVENGNIYVVWNDHNNTNGAGTDRDIFYRCNLTSTDWEPVQVISEPVIGRNLNIFDSSLPHIAVENGKIFTVWDDQNNTDGAGTDRDMFYRCNLTTLNWEDVDVISEPIPGQNINTGDKIGPTIAVDNAKVGIVWGGSNNTNNAGTDYDIFYRWKNIVLPSLFLNSPKVTPASGNTSTEFNFTIKYYQLNNTPPTRMKVIIDGIEYSMKGVDQTDGKYTDGKKYYYTIKNLEIDTHTYEFNASDGVNFTNSKVFNNLVVVNSLPQILTEDNVTAIEDEYYETIYEYEDFDITNVGQSCHWEFATNASWLSFNTETGKLNGTPGNDDVGKYWVYLSVNDTLDIVFTNFTLKVLDVNDDPLIDTANVKLTNEDELYEVDYNATDIDSPIKHQIWSLESNTTSWLNISTSTGILNGTPTNDDVGEYWVNVTVNDTEGGFDSTNFTLTVLNVNDNPTIKTEDIITAETDKLYEVQYNATDIDSPRSKFSWSLNTNATWLSIDPITGVLSGTPTRDDEGMYIINVTVSDSHGGIDWHEFILAVYKGNLPPIIITEDVETTRVNKSYEVDYNATDDRSIGLLEWYIKTNASWLSIDSNTGVISGTPILDHGGKSYWVNISVLDTQDGHDYHNYTLTVLKEPIIIVKNNIPKLMNFKLVPAEGDTNTDFTFSVTYADEDDDPPDFIKVVIDEVAFDMKLRSGGLSYHGIYKYTTKLSEGEHSYYYTASDGTDTNTSYTLSTPNIQKPKKVDDDGDEKEGLAWEFLILIIVIIIIVVLVILFLVIGKKKKEEEEYIPPIQPEISEPVIETDQTQIQVPSETPVYYPEYETEGPMVQEDLYTVPLEEQTTVTTMPDYTTPVQPEVEEKQGFESMEEGVEVIEE